MGTKLLFHKKFSYKIKGDAVESSVALKRLTMKLIVVLTFCALVSYTCAIHNGEVVEPNSIPYQVLLLVYRDGKTSKCGGSLVKADRVLTAGKKQLNSNQNKFIINSILISSSLLKRQRLR